MTSYRSLVSGMTTATAFKDSLTAGWAKAGRQLGHKSLRRQIVIHHHLNSGLKTKAANFRVDFTFGIISFHILWF